MASEMPFRSGEGKPWAAYGDAFYDVQLPGFFYNNLGLGTNMERDVIKFELSLYKKFSFLTVSL